MRTDENGRVVNWRLMLKHWWFSQSQLATYTACRHLWWLKFVLGLEEIERNKVLGLGSLWHECMDRLWRAWTGGQAKDLETALSAAELVVGSLAVGDEKYEAEVSAKAIGMLVRYLRRWEGPVGTVLCSEQEVSAYPVIAEGPLSAWSRTNRVNTRIMGKPDKIVVENGEVWVVEHKSTSMDLQQWRDKHSYSPQAAIYCWLVMCGWRRLELLDKSEESKRALERGVAGIVYDLASTADVATAEDCVRIKSGALSKQLPRNLSAEVFSDAVAQAEPADWYEEKRRELEANPPRLFSRYQVRIDHEEMSRTMAEVAVLAQQARKIWRVAQDEARGTLGGISSLDGEMVYRRAVAQHLRNYGHRYERCESNCWAYNRRCPMMDVCSYRSLESLETILIP